MMLKFPIEDPVVDFGILQDDLDWLNAWLRKWHLGTSHEKCNLMHVNAHYDCSSKIDVNCLNSSTILCVTLC